MPRFTYDQNRVNLTVSQTGKEYQLRLLQRAQAIFTTLLNLLPSNYVSSVQGPNYTIELKAVAVELARIELALEDVDTDISFETVRAEFIYSIAAYLVFLNGKLPPTEFDDVMFKRFVMAMIDIYFQGSIPKSMREVAQYFLSDQVEVTENFLLIRQGATSYDISDQFGFNVDVHCSNNQFPADTFRLDSIIRMLLDIVRPAHTLFRIRYVFRDEYLPNDGAGILDSMRWHLSSYWYEDFRKYCAGIRDRDRLGVKTNRSVVGEDHSEDF